MEQKHPIAWHVPNLINICIDSVDDGEMTGKIYLDGALVTKNDSEDTCSDKR